MISITRSLTRRVRAVVRLALQLSGGSSVTPVMFRTGASGLEVAAQSSTATAIFHQPGKALVDETVIVPFSCLADCEAKKDVPLTLEARSKQHVVLSWQDGAVQQALQVQASKPFDLPVLPKTWADNPPRLLDGLHEASQTAARDQIRYALDHIQLRENGQVVGTDGHQLLVQPGFQFPWKGDVVVPSSKLFACKELPRNVPVSVARLDKSLALRVGPWTFVWCIPEGRYPAVDDLVKQENVTTRLRVSEADAAFLAENLLRLPSSDEYELPVTLDIRRQVAVRAQGEGHDQPTELALANSTVEGEPVAVSSNRSFLKRALDLGCREFCLFGGKDGRVLCPGADRTYVWMQLDQASVIAPSAKASRIESVQEQPARTTNPNPVSVPEPLKEEEPMPRERTSSDQQPIEDVRWRTVESDQPPLAQAEALRDSLRDVLLKTGDLIATLKRQRRQTKIVQSTLASLKELQKVAG